MTQADSTSTPRIDPKLVRDLLHYDPVSGVFTWKARAREHCVSKRSQSTFNSQFAGKEAGMVFAKSKGGTLYRKIGLLQREYGAHVLAFAWMTGRWPIGDIDHRDGDGLNNKWDNLREATRSQNIGNSRRPTHNRTGLKGVGFHKQCGRYQARIRVENVQMHLGLFDTAEEAHAAYVKAARKYFGEFARTE